MIPIQGLSDAEAHKVLLARASSVPIEPLDWPLARRKGVDILVRREDRIDPFVSGNKYYKLYFNLLTAKRQGLTRLASFGGAYSNHLHALAAAGQRLGLETHGLIRGERPPLLNPTLTDAERWGMQLHFISRTQYARKTSEAFMAEWQAHLGPVYWLPEGGANTLGVRGTAVIGEAIESSLRGRYDQVCVAVGTGGTLAGITAGLPADKLTLGFSVLKGQGKLGEEMTLALLKHGLHNSGREHACWRLISGFHGGGYGRRPTPELWAFWQAFEAETGVPLDPVYTLKLFWGIHCLLEQDYWPRGTRLVAVHTGGLQGRRGYLPATQ